MHLEKLDSHSNHLLKSSQFVAFRNHFEKSHWEEYALPTNQAALLHMVGEKLKPKEKGVYANDFFSYDPSPLHLSTSIPSFHYPPELDVELQRTPVQAINIWNCGARKLQFPPNFIGDRVGPIHDIALPTERALVLAGLIEPNEKLEPTLANAVLRYSLGQVVDMLREKSDGAVKDLTAYHLSLLPPDLMELIDVELRAEEILHHAQENGFDVENTPLLSYIKGPYYAYAGENEVLKKIALPPEKNWDIAHPTTREIAIYTLYAMFGWHRPEVLAGFLEKRGARYNFSENDVTKLLKQAKIEKLRKAR